jgi:hypothetical protein
MYPAQQVSINKLSMLLHDRYYLGYVTYDGEEFRGRHEALIDQDLFDRVQAIAATRSAAGERRRVHHHYLKGSLFCGRCEQAGSTQRMIIVPHQGNGSSATQSVEALLAGFESPCTSSTTVVPSLGSRTANTASLALAAW